MVKHSKHEFYDFRNPPNRSGFGWEEINKEWQKWTTAQYVIALNHKLAIDGFKSDFDAMKWADTCLLVLPCGRSAHTEAGYMKGQGKRVYALILEPQEPELMYKMFDGIITDGREFVDFLMQG